MNILLIKHFFVGFMVSEIPRVSVFGHCLYSGTVRIRLLSPIYKIKPTKFNFYYALVNKIIKPNNTIYYN